jgi:hypothetical protein
MIEKRVIGARQSLGKRLASPVLIVFFSWLAATLIYNNAWRFLEPQIHRPLAVVCVFLMGASIIFGTLLIYPLAFSRGASLRERIIGCLITPIAWILKELVMISYSYSIGETIYDAFNPLYLGTISLMVVEMGICEIVCRLVVRQRNGLPIRQAVSAGPIITILAGIGALYIFNAWGDRVGFWYVHQALYQYLFVK